MSHSEEIRKAVLRYIDDGGLVEEATKLYKVSRSSVQRWRIKKNLTGSLANEQRVVEPYKLKDDALINYINDYPDAYIYEIAEHFKVSTGCVSTALKRLKITRKKKVLHTKKQIHTNGKNL